MGKQTIQGKGFEYACLKTFYEFLSVSNIRVNIADNKAYFTAKSKFEELPNNVREDMLLAASASVQSIINSEPNLINGEELIEISIAEDKKGSEGDVRDLIFLKSESGWEVGISCKHNHHALKHSRLSQTIDFGDKWLGYPVSDTYWESITPVFSYLQKLKDETKTLDKKLQNKWDKIPNKDLDVYRPILDAFHDEVIRLSKEYKDVPKKLIEYLLGRKDFYKVIAKDNERKTIIQAFNLQETLSTNCGKVKPRSKCKSLAGVLPKMIYSFDYKEGSSNTLILVLDKGWTISFRIHNASSRIEPSLKFDIQLVGIPSAVANIEQYWEE